MNLLCAIVVGDSGLATGIVPGVFSALHRVEHFLDFDQSQQEHEPRLLLTRFHA